MSQMVCLCVCVCVLLLLSFVCVGRYRTRKDTFRSSKATCPHCFAGMLACPMGKIQGSWDRAKERRCFLKGVRTLTTLQPHIVSWCSLRKIAYGGGCGGDLQGNHFVHAQMPVENISSKTKPLCKPGTRFDHRFNNGFMN